MRIIGTQNRDEIELDPVKAYHRGRMMDALLRNALPPLARGLYRGSPEYFQQLDEERMVQIAARLNTP